MPKAASDSAFLKKVKLFSEFDSKELGAISALLKEEKFASQTKIIAQGEMGDCLYIVREGFVNVVRGDEKETSFITALGAGEYFGESALFQDIPRTANILAGGQVSVLKLSRSQLQKFLKANPKASSKFFYTLLKELFKRLSLTSSELAAKRQHTLNQAEIDVWLSKFQTV